MHTNKWSSIYRNNFLKPWNNMYCLRIIEAKHTGTVMQTHTHTHIHTYAHTHTHTHTHTHIYTYIYILRQHLVIWPHRRPTFCHEMPLTHCLHYPNLNIYFIHRYWSIFIHKYTKLYIYIYICRGILRVCNPLCLLALFDGGVEYTDCTSTEK